MGTHLRVIEARAFQWIPTLEGLDVFQKSLYPCALDESSLSIGKVHREIDIYIPHWFQVKLKKIGNSYQKGWSSVPWNPLCSTGANGIKIKRI